FSSRRRHTRSTRDWSSDVCSSDLHHHGDHAYGNQVFVENGAVPIAHTGVIEEMKRYETGYYGNQQGAWEAAAKGRVDLRASKLRSEERRVGKESRKRGNYEHRQRK